MAHNLGLSAQKIASLLVQDQNSDDENCSARHEIQGEMTPVEQTQENHLFKSCKM